MTIDQPNITSIPADRSNLWPGRQGKICSIVCHTMSGTYEGTGGWFQTPNVNGSSNYGVAEDGRIACYVEAPDAPFANGGLDGQDSLVQTIYTIEHNVNPNFWTLSIEHEDHSIPNHQITDYPAQFAASTQLSAYLCQQHGLDPSQEGVFLGHYEFDSVNRPNCPGWTAATWDAYINEVIRLVDNGGLSVDAMARIDRLEKLLIGNGATVTFQPNEGPNGELIPINMVFGEDAFKLIEGGSLGLALFEIREKMARKGIT